MSRFLAYLTAGVALAVLTVCAGPGQLLATEAVSPVDQVHTNPAAHRSSSAAPKPKAGSPKKPHRRRSAHGTASSGTAPSGPRR